MVKIFIAKLIRSTWIPVQRLHWIFQLTNVGSVRVLKSNFTLCQRYTVQESTRLQETHSLFTMNNWEFLYSSAHVKPYFNMPSVESQKMPLHKGKESFHHTNKF